MYSLQETSKFIALILRHKPEEIGISLDEHGWANVDELIARISKRQPFSFEMLEEIVRTDEKMRYAFNVDKTMIRAIKGIRFPLMSSWKKEYRRMFRFTEREKSICLPFRCRD